MVELKTYPMNFDSFVGWDENDIEALVGVSSESFKDLVSYVKPYTKQFFTSILNVSVENLVLILDATYLYIQKPSDHQFQIEETHILCTNTGIW